jgi:hypothetical protein
MGWLLRGFSKSSESQAGGRTGSGGKGERQECPILGVTWNSCLLDWIAGVLTSLWREQD